MTDSKLLETGYLALHEAHGVAGMVVHAVREKQAQNQPVQGKDFHGQFLIIEKRIEAALCAFRELENRAAGNPPPKNG